MSILEIRHLTKTFSDKGTVLKDINLQFNSGEFVIIAGTNGSGKTVLIRHFNGLISPTSGEVLLNGTPINNNLVDTRKQIGLVFQNSDHQIVAQTVAEDVAFGPTNLKLPLAEISDRVTTALAATGLTKLANQSPHDLSGGQKRKLAIAGVLAMKPKILVFDEPFTGLDYPGVIQILQQLVALHQQGQTIIVITHELEKVLAHASRLIIINHGQIVRDAHPAELLDQLQQYDIHRPCATKDQLKTLTWLENKN